MGFFRRIKDTLIRRQYGRIARYLASADPDEIMATSEKRLLKAFAHAARTVPAYKALLAERGVDADAVRTISQFKRDVPLVDKDLVFAANALRDCCTGGRLDDVPLFYTSSGHSGVFSFGAESPGGTERAALGLEFLLDRAFAILDRKTLYINCNGMGVRVPTRALTLAETSVRSDSVLALVEKLAADFDQIIINGESMFLKKVIEEGVERGIPWRDLTVHLVTGGEFIAENFRSYIGHLLGLDFHDPSKGLFGISMGLSELSVSIFNESAKTIGIRRAAQTDRDLRYALFGDGTEVCPELMQYYPHQTYIETVADESGAEQLVVSMLDLARKIPLIRYNTHDTVGIMTYRQLTDILDAHGYQSLHPEFHLPLVRIQGRTRSAAERNALTVTPAEIKEGLYADFDLAGQVTGNFTITRQDEQTVVLVQMKEGREPVDEVATRLSAGLKTYTPAAPAVEMLAYRDFPHGIEHNFEKKNRYVTRPQ